MEIIPIWTVSHSAADAIANAAKALEVDAVLIGQSRRSAFYHRLRGHVVKGLMKKLPRDCHLMIYNDSASVKTGWNPSERKRRICFLHSEYDPSNG
jgi:K+-sensing histidine kinase KdpD